MFTINLDGHTITPSEETLFGTIDPPHKKTPLIRKPPLGKKRNVYYKLRRRHDCPPHKKRCLARLPPSLKQHTKTVPLIKDRPTKTNYEGGSFIKGGVRGGFLIWGRRLYRSYLINTPSIETPRIRNLCRRKTDFPTINQGGQSLVQLTPLTRKRPQQS